MRRLVSVLCGLCLAGMGMSQSLQDEYTIDATAELRLVAPEPYCEINVLVDKASFGEATRDDPCQSEENVELTLSPVLGHERFPQIPPVLLFLVVLRQNGPSITAMLPPW